MRKKNIENIYPCLHIYVLVRRNDALALCFPSPQSSSVWDRVLCFRYFFSYFVRRGSIFIEATIQNQVTLSRNQCCGSGSTSFGRIRIWIHFILTDQGWIWVADKKSTKIIRIQYYFK